MVNHGLTEKQLELIKHVLAPYTKQIDKVCLFGSRATGSYRENSDIDLVIHGVTEEKVINRLWTLFDESSLPYKVDVKGYELTTYPPLKLHMDDTETLLFTKDDLLS
jgi:predicted nucleotidyltransferase